MSITRKSIFELERRCNLDEEFDLIVSDLRKTPIKSCAIASKSLEMLLDSCIKTWPFRQGATSIDSFAKSHGFFSYDAYSDEEMLYYLELIVNLLHWAPFYESNLTDYLDMSMLDDSTVTMECDRCIENIEYLLERLNMRIRKIEKMPISQYVITKRDAQVDTVIEAVPELSEALLSYMDIRNQKDENAKKTVLKAIADYLEDRHKSKYYKGTAFASLEDNIFTVFNKVGIRHGDKKQWKLSKPARMKLYDQTFTAAIHLLQMEDVKNFNDTVSDLKEKQLEQMETRDSLSE